jgi:hypothetical protein
MLAGVAGEADGPDEFAVHDDWQAALDPAPFRNCVRSGAAPTPTQTSTAGLPSFSAWTFSWPAPCPPLFMEFQWRVIIQRRCTSCGSSVENIPLQAERHSARRQKLFAFPPESAFSFRPECCSESQRNRVRLQTGIVFTFDRIPQNLWAVCFIIPRKIFFKPSRADGNSVEEPTDD